MITKMGQVCIAGFLGTIVVTCMFTFASPTLVGGPTDIAAVLAGLLGGSWLAGMAMHFVVGMLVLPVIYATLVERRLPGGPPVRGAIWGVSVWAVSQTIVFPLSGAGLFSSASGGLPAVLDSLVGHLAYGLVLGICAGGPNEHAFGLGQEFVAKPRMRRVVRPRGQTAG